MWHVTLFGSAQRGGLEMVQQKALTPGDESEHPGAEGSVLQGRITLGPSPTRAPVQRHGERRSSATEIAANAAPIYHLNNIYATVECV